MKLSIDYQKIKSSIEIKRYVSKMIIGSAVVLTLSPLFFKSQLNINARLSLALSGFVFSISCLNLPKTDYEDKLLKTYEDTYLKHQKSILTSEIMQNQTYLEIQNQQKLADIIERLDDYKIDYYADKYGISHLISKNYIDSNINQKESTVNELSLSNSIFENIIETVERESNIELKWLESAIQSSCFIAGKKRSGKTYLMKWLLLAFCENMSDKDVFFISDPHYDDVDFDDVWISEKIDKQLIANKRLVKSESDTLKMLNQIISIGETRKKLGQTLKKGIGRIRIFLDEIDSYSNDVQSVISDTIKTIEYQYAKYGFTVVLGCHSLKKSENGVDSSVVSSMLNILFPSVALDRNNILSGSFPTIPKIKSMINSYADTIPKESRIVLIADDNDVYVSHIPKLTMPKINIKDNEIIDDDILKIKKWCDLCYEKYQKYPDKEHIKTAYFETTNRQLNDIELDDLLIKIGIN